MNMQPLSLIRNILVISFILISTIQFIHGAETVIQGKTPSYAGQKITFHTYSNMISFKEIEVFTCLVNDSGEFHCSFELDQTRLIYTNLGIYNCFLYAEPGFIYEIRLPERRDKTEAEKMNPYFEHVSIHLVSKVSQTTGSGEVPDPNNELNFLIRTFNDTFYPFYYKFVINAAANIPDRKEIDLAIENITAPFFNVNHKFFLECLLDMQIIYVQSSFSNLWDQKQ